ncbi:hypothetical protein, partial [Klebsiella pneumoniae]|uniref:hypothetical protein n=1 Tax=Klebsiella pneumoniae TaxID=573 RepID=UPI003721A6C0
ECLGPLRPADDARINSLFFDTIETIDRGTAADATMLASLAAAIETDLSPARKAGRRGRAALVILLVLGAALLAWQLATFVSRTMVER